MHFSKAYEQLLSTLPPELRSKAFEYRKLKRLINQTVSELDSLGLGPSVLQSLHEPGHNDDDLVRVENDDESPTLIVDSENPTKRTTFAYEIALNSTLPEPRLRLSSDLPDVETLHSPTLSATQPIYHVNLLIPERLFTHIMTTLLHSPAMLKDQTLSRDVSTDPHFSDLIIPLPSDTAFVQLLTSTLASISVHVDTLIDDFNSALATLAESISLTALPASSSDPHSFSAYSLTANNAMTLRPHQGGKSDLYTWREIFRIYAEAQVFESVTESSHGERSIDDMETQLRLFEEHIREKKVSLVLPASRDAVDAFLRLNEFVLNVKKFQLANAEATRKILKKHTKRTALSIPSRLLERDTSTSMSTSSQLVPIGRTSNSLPRLLVQAIGEVLLPIVPHIDDYACLICTHVAFKPIRLGCGHFFCVRCLAKLQRRGAPSCPLCRAPTVLKANPSNIDYGLLNFIADWFPLESLEKMRVDEREIHQEQLEQLGIADAHVCRIM